MMLTGGIGLMRRRQNISFSLVTISTASRSRRCAGTPSSELRAWKVFKAMSLFIGSRTADQCRSHHQKMEKNYNSCREIIAGFRVGIKP